MKNLTTYELIDIIKQFNPENTADKFLKRKAFNELYERNKGKFTGYCLSIASKFKFPQVFDERFDLHQEAWINISNAIQKGKFEQGQNHSQIQQDKKFFNWSKTIILNAAIDKHRKRAKDICESTERNCYFIFENFANDNLDEVLTPELLEKLDKIVLQFIETLKEREEFILKTTMDYETNEIPLEVMEAIKNKYSISHETALRARNRAISTVKRHIMKQYYKIIGL